MIAAIVPAKCLDVAKGRLADLLSQSERRTLAMTMLTDVLLALKGVPGLARIAVVTLEREIEDLATGLAVETWREPVSAGYTAAVNFGTARAMSIGATALLTIAGDVPAVTSGEIGQMLEALELGATAVLVPSLDGAGTNGVVLSPPDAMPLAFGEPSFDNHVATASRVGLRATVLRLPGLGLDIDRPSDLLSFLIAPSDTHTYRTIASWNLPLRLVDHER